MKIQMATTRSQEAICRIVEDKTLTLERKAGWKTDYNGVVVIEDTLLVIDNNASNLQLYSSRDGKLLFTSHRLEFIPKGICLISKTEVAVCLSDKKIVILSFKFIDDVKRVKTLNLRTRFRECHSAAKLNSTDKLVVSGLKDHDGMMLSWGVISITEGRVESTYNICKGYGSHLVIKDNTIYISCLTDDSTTRGVYAYDILNPHTHKFLYQHRELKSPWSIMVDGRDSIFVSDEYSNRIHQLSDSGQVVAIHTVSSRPSELFYNDQHGVLYTTSRWSNVITVYRMEYVQQPGVPIEILKMDERSIKLFEEALKGGKETVYNIRVMVVGHMGVGKTTLVKRLLGEEVNICERRSTEGIEVYANCCDVSLSTHEWTRRGKDSEEDYKLQRLVNVLNENYQRGGSVFDSELDATSNQREKTNGNHTSHVADDDKTSEALYHRSQRQNFGQKVSSTPSLHMESSSSVVQSNLTQSETNRIPGSELGENISTENDKTDPLRDMLKLLQQNPNKAKQDVNKYAHLTMLDFAGQYAFYTTHQMFLSRRAIYLLVSDASREVMDLVEDECYFDSEGIMTCNVHDLVEIWMNSIHACAPPDTENWNSDISRTSSYKVLSPPVILVGTHIDQIPQSQPRMVSNSACHIFRPVIPSGINPAPRNPIKIEMQAQQDYRRECGQRYLMDIRSYLLETPTAVHLVDGDFAIDNTVLDSKLEELKRKIVEVASQQPYWGEQIPTRWFLLEQQLMRLRDAGVKVISHTAVEVLNKGGTVRIEESEELDLFLRYLHETGTIIYFSVEVLRDNIVLDPKWLIHALKSLINAHTNLTNSPADSAVTQNWSDFKERGILTSDLVDAVWTKEKYPELHTHKDHILLLLEQLHIIAKPRSFSEMGEKVENYLLAPCMLRQESPREVISPELDSWMESTPVLCFVFKGKFLPPPIFHRLLAACVTRWPIAKKNETSENLIFCGCCIFDLDLFHRLTLHCRNHIVFARITRLVIDEVKTLDAKLCTRVRKFITLNLSKITSYLGQNLQYQLRLQYPPTKQASVDGMVGFSLPFEMWFADEGHDSDAPIKREHMNHARLCLALVTVCGNAMREILLTQVPAPYTNIYQAILTERSILTSRRQVRPGQLQTALLNHDLCQLVFPDPKGRYMSSVEQFDISLLYTLIRTISSVPAPSTCWGNDPLDRPRDRSLGANVERIRSYRNHIIGHSMDGKIGDQDFDRYWNKIDAVLDDIEHALGRQGYRAQLGEQMNQVISVYEAC